MNFDGPSTEESLAMARSLDAMLAKGSKGSKGGGGKKRTDGVDHGDKGNEKGAKSKRMKSQPPDDDVHQNTKKDCYSSLHFTNFGLSFPNCH